MSGDDNEWAVDDEQFDDPGDVDQSDGPADDVAVENGDDTADDEWRYSLEDIEDDDEESEDDEEGAGNVFGSIQSATDELESGSPSLENVFFVVVGVVLALLLFAQFLLVIIGGA